MFIESVEADRRAGPAVGEGPLLADAIIVPACRVEFWQDVFSAGIGFG